MTSRLELERGTDILLLETGDALLLEGPQDYTREASVIIGDLVSATRALAIDRDSSVLMGVVVSATKIWSHPELFSRRTYGRCLIATHGYSRFSLARGFFRNQY